MKQRSFFGEEFAYDILEKVNDPLVRTEEAVDWSIFDQTSKDFRGRKKDFPPSSHVQDLDAPGTV